LGSPTSKGRPMINMLPLSDGEKVSTVLVLPEEGSDWENTHIMFATSRGHVRRNKLSDFMNIRSNGKIAMKLDEGEDLIAVKTCTEADDVMLSTALGKCIRFNVDEVRVFAGRDSTGVRGVKLADKDSVISMTILGQGKLSPDERDLYLRQASKLRQLDDEMPEEESTVEGSLTQERFDELAAGEQFILTITENGYGKRSSAYEYRTTGRGGVGVDSIIVNARNGGVVASFPVEEKDQIMLVTDAGKLIRCPIHDVRIAGRRTQGVTIFRIADDERVVSVSHIPGDKINDEEDDSLENTVETGDTQVVETPEEI
jgi:DNA gyrase subunit A